MAGHLLDGLTCAALNPKGPHTWTGRGGHRTRCDGLPSCFQPSVPRRQAPPLAPVQVRSRRARWTRVRACDRGASARPVLEAVNRPEPVWLTPLPERSSEATLSLWAQRACVPCFRDLSAAPALTAARFQGSAPVGGILQEGPHSISALLSATERPGDAEAVASHLMGHPVEGRQRLWQGPKSNLVQDRSRE